MTVQRGTWPFYSVALAALLSGNTLVAQPPEAPRAPGEGEPRRGTLKANGVSIAFESHGPQDRETVLLIMGTGAQLTGWPPELIDALVARGFRVVAYDHRDTGLSTKFDAAGAPDWAGIMAAKAQGSLEGGKDTAANIPGAELRVIPGMGHDCPVQLVGQIADAIAAAASRARKSGPAAPKP